MLLFHAAALLALAALRAAPVVSTSAAFGALLLVIGLVLFCGDVILGATGGDLFPMAAPIGGSRCRPSSG